MLKNRRLLPSLMMVQLIADSGSTKTDWLFLMEGEERSFSTAGLNPYRITEEAMISLMRKSVLPHCGSLRIEQIHFYGAGCGNDEKKSMVRKALEACLKSDEVHVETDLLGAARAVLKNRAGFTGIIGTGANSGLYDGAMILQSVSPLGYLIGDEGSGTHLGKLLLRKWLRSQLSNTLENQLSGFCAMTHDELFTHIYQQKDPGPLLAGFAPFINENRQEAALQEILRENFRDYFKAFVLPYSRISGPLNFTGSIAYYFQEMLSLVAVEFHFDMGRVLRSPIEGLAEYHLESQ